MKGFTISKKFIFGYILGTFLLMSSVYFTPSYGSVDDLEFLISVEKFEFVLGEPVKVNFILTNKGADDFTAPIGLSYSHDDVRIFISKDNEDFEQYISASAITGIFSSKIVSPITINAGESIQSSEFILFDVVSDSLAFPEPGNYKIKADLTIFGFTEPPQESNLIMINIVDPVGDEIQALNFIQQNDLELFLTDDWRLFPDVDVNPKIPQVEELLQDFSNTIYTATIDLSPHSDLSINKQLIELDENNIKYILTVHDNGPDKPEGTQILDIISDGFLFNQGKSSENCSQTQQNVLCILENFGEGSVQQVEIVFDIPLGFVGDVSNEAQISSNTFDPELKNNNVFLTSKIGPPIGGEMIPINTTSLILAGTQMNAAWMIPVIVSAIGIGIVLARKF